jgi:hypothetical protein
MRKKINFIRLETRFVYFDPFCIKIIDFLKRESAIFKDIKNGLQILFT